MKNNLDGSLLERFFRKECSSEEARMVYEWLQDPKNEASISKTMQQRWQELMSNPSENIYYLPQQLPDTPRGQRLNTIMTPQPATPKRSFRIYPIAAAITLLLLAGMAAFIYLNQTPDTPPTSAVIWKTRETQRGQKLKFQLQDGTLVTLNTESKLIYPDTFSTQERRVILEGEAYFEVAEDKTHPFRVVSDSIVTTALGTAFNIYNPDSTNQLVVSLVHGKVSVEKSTPAHHDTASQILTPGESMIYDKFSQDMKKSQFDLVAMTAWKDNLLILKSATIEEIKIRLESWYDVRINYINKPKSNWTYTGEFRNESLENVLKGISFSKNINYQINDKDVTITFK